jgi:phenylalanyl-tRNA synthetase alpha chain
VLVAFADAGDARKFEELAAECGIDQSLVSAAAASLAERGWIEITEESLTEPELTEAGKEAAEKGTPERRLILLLDLELKVPMPEVHQVAAEKGFDGKAAVQWVFRKKWAEKRKPANGGGPDELRLTHAGEEALMGASDDEVAIGRVARGEITYLEELSKDGIDAEELVKALRSRKELVKLRFRTIRRASITDDGRAALDAGVSAAEEVSSLTPELLASGRWRDVTFKKFDVTLAAERIRAGKIHPLVRIIQETREAFLSMGFEEAESESVESGFWDFDALFQPQDHPAREMQDTFYLKRPSTLALPDDEEMIDRVKRTHEDGGDTGSAGWGYEWSREKATQAILRTHTTATTVRALSLDPNPPRKVFTIGKVFRRETISYKHLAEFMQIDGIVVDEKATLATLKGTLTEFYRQLGFDKVKFKPSFFPYTEPSAEVYIYSKRHDQWVEVCGSGIFRPEVTEPLGCRVPVLAWGGGLERIALLRYGASHIKALYDDDLDWLREVPLCR